MSYLDRTLLKAVKENKNLFIVEDCYFVDGATENETSCYIKTNKSLQANDLLFTIHLLDKEGKSNFDKVSQRRMLFRYSPRNLINLHNKSINSYFVLKVKKVKKENWAKIININIDDTNIRNIKKGYLFSRIHI